MFRTLFLILLLVPAVELYVLISVGSVIGALPTILLTVATAVAGAALMRSQGLMTVQRLQAQVAMGEPPQQSLVEGGMILLGGMLLLIPGFITDTLGLALLVPPLRQRLAERWVRRLRTQQAARGGVIIDGEVVWRQDSEALPSDQERRE